MGWHRGSIAGSALVLTLLAGCAGSTSGGDDPSKDASGSGSSSTSSNSSGSSDSPSVPPGTTQVTLAASGDLLAHASVIESAEENAKGKGYDFVPMFANVRKDLSAADLALCHMETPLSPDDTNLTRDGVLVFNSPHELATAAAKVGYDGCDFASNHTWDRGRQGVADTRQVLTDNGLGYAGPAVKDSPDRRRATYDVGDATVAQLAYTYTLYNDGSPTTTVPPEAPSTGHNLWPKVGTEGILSDARAAKKDGADFVVVSMHWGMEYQTEPTQQQREMARTLLESDAVDLILGTHVHVVQPCETINGKTVFYGMGNFLSNQSPKTASSLRTETQEGLYATVTLREKDGKVTSSKATYQPTRVNLEGHVIEKATPKQHPKTYERVTDTMGSLGKGACEAKPAS